MGRQESPGILLELVVVLPAELPEERQDYLARLAGRLGLTAVQAPIGAGADRLRTLAAAASPAVVLPGRVPASSPAAPSATDTPIDPDPAFGPEPNVILVAGRDLAEVARRRAAATPGSTIAVELTAAIGRTRNEAVARAERDPRMRAGDARPEDGLFGTFEQAQEQVLELARAGATQLRLTLADELDVADLMAQVRALVVGATPALLARD